MYEYCKPVLFVCLFINVHLDFFFFFKDPAFYDLWDQLKYNGILEGRLINHVWSKFKPEDRHQLLDIMEQFDLICTAPSAEGPMERRSVGYAVEGTGKSSPIYLRRYFVPSQFNPGNVKDESKMASWDSLTFFVDFHGFFTSKAPYRFPSRCKTHYTLFGAFFCNKFYNFNDNFS